MRREEEQQKLKEKDNQTDSSYHSSDNSQAEKKNLDSMKNPKLSQKSLTHQEAWDKVHGHLPLHFINEKSTLSLMPYSKPLFISRQEEREWEQILFPLWAILD